MSQGTADAWRTWVILVFIAIGIGVFLYWSFGTPEGRATRARDKARRPQPISKLGVKTAAGLACPKCGGTQFKAGRKTSTKLAFGAASMLGRARNVRCVTCGTQFVRG